MELSFAGAGTWHDSRLVRAAIGLPMPRFVSNQARPISLLGALHRGASHSSLSRRSFYHSYPYLIGCSPYEHTTLVRNTEKDRSGMCRTCI